MKNKEYEPQILQWQAGRYESLVRENGWLALTGLSWLKEGRNLIGSNPLCEINLPEHAPTFLGIVEKKGRAISFHAAQGVPVHINGRLVEKTILKSDQDAKPSFVAWKQIQMVIHEHVGKFAMRIWDNGRTERFSLPPLTWFPINKHFRLNAHYKRYPEPRSSGQPDTFGDTVEDRMDGNLSFSFEGTRYRLDVTETKTGKLYLKFKDLTSGKETYPPSRYLYTEPVADGKVVLDFNYAYSPPSAFTAFATCIFAPPQNHLPFRVEAGEIYKRLGARNKTANIGF